MPSWKRILLRSAGFGAGFALTLCIVVGVWVWYSGKPEPPKPWDRKAITAEYDHVRPEGDQNNLRFRYVLQNNTDFDYRIDSDSGIEITAKLQVEKGFGDFSSKSITTQYPIFVPAKSRVRISLDIPHSYPIKERSDFTPEESRRYRAAVESYVTERLNNLDGFVLFDINRRYEIEFPSGWENAVKAAPSADKK
jgi:hypothetical protein